MDTDKDRRTAGNTDGRTAGNTDGRTDGGAGGQTDEHGQTFIPLPYVIRIKTVYC